MIVDGWSWKRVGLGDKLACLNTCSQDVELSNFRPLSHGELLIFFPLVHPMVFPSIIPLNPLVAWVPSRLLYIPAQIEFKAGTLASNFHPDGWGLDCCHCCHAGTVQLMAWVTRHQLEARSISNCTNVHDLAIENPSFLDCFPFFNGNSSKSCHKAAFYPMGYRHAPSILLIPFPLIIRHGSRKKPKCLSKPTMYADGESSKHVLFLEGELGWLILRAILGGKKLSAYPQGA